MGEGGGCKTHQIMNIVDSKIGVRVAATDADLDRDLVLEDLVRGRHFLLHALRHGRHVIGLVGPELACRHTLVTGVGVLGHEVQRRVVEEHEVPPPERVESVEGGKHAVGVVGQRGPRRLAVGDEGVVAQVVGADPDGVDGVGGR